MKRYFSNALISFTHIQSLCDLVQFDTLQLVYLWVIRRIILNDPVYFRNIQSSSSHISAQENTRLCLTEVKECCSPLLLFLSSLVTNIQAYKHQLNTHAQLHTHTRTRTHTVYYMVTIFMTHFSGPTTEVSSQYTTHTDTLYRNVSVVEQLRVVLD